MTCVIALKDKDTMFMGADSIGSNGHVKAVRKDVKIFKKNNLLIGGTTSFRMLQLLQYSFEIPVIKNFSHKYMCSVFIPALQECFKKGKWLKKDDDIVSGGQFIVAGYGRIYGIENDFQVSEHYDSYMAVGCGREVAWGSLYATEGTKTTPAKRITLALSAASYFIDGVGKPFKILSLK